ncbi:MAG TPA: MarR family transcriptional regulator [Ktedonobacterales bacterium]|nr:MarR family transcriptional regulator [Ktedonobacterales bacterium]
MTHATLHNLGYQLYMAHRAAAYGLAQALRQSCAAHGKSYVVTPPQWGMLATLAETDGLPAGKLCRALSSDAPTMTGIISRLEQSGLVRRQHDQADRRVVKVFLTAEGRAAMEFLPAATQDFLRSLTAGISATEQQQLNDGLARLIANVERMLPGNAESRRRGRLPEAPLQPLPPPGDYAARWRATTRTTRRNRDDT